MFYTYTYSEHELNDLYIAVRKFMHRLYYDRTLDRKKFDLDLCCDGELLMRARVGTKDTKLVEHLKKFYDDWFSLDVVDRKSAYLIFKRMNRIEQQLANSVERVTVEDLPEKIKESTKNLFGHMYQNSLTPSRCDSYWERSYSLLSVKTCPFCGIEPMHDYRLYKQDFDHVLCKSTYPFASVNLKNLVPCGRDCNQIFKHEKDMVFAKDRRRRAYYAFGQRSQMLDVDLTGSVLPSAGDDPGKWSINFGPAHQEVETWIDVFELENRYRHDIFSVYYDRWRKDFLNWVFPQAKPSGGWTGKSILERMRAYAETLQEDPLIDQRFLKRALFLFVIAQPDLPIFGAIAQDLNSRKG